MHNVSTQQLPQYCQLQRVTITIWIASATWYSRLSLARSKTLQNFWLTLLKFSVIWYQICQPNTNFDRYIRPIDRKPIDTTTPDQSVPGSNGHKEVLYTPLFNVLVLLDILKSYLLYIQALLSHSFKFISTYLIRIISFCLFICLVGWLVGWLLLFLWAGG